jgi:hypothetical protein
MLFLIREESSTNAILIPKLLIIHKLACFLYCTAIQHIISEMVEFKKYKLLLQATGLTGLARMIVSEG